MLNILGIRRGTESDVRIKGWKRERGGKIAVE
jgi:hypothetical protein